MQKSIVSQNMANPCFETWTRVSQNMDWPLIFLTFETQLEMHDEIFHFEIFENFMKILKYFKTPFEIFHETFNSQYK